MTGHTLTPASNPEPPGTAVAYLRGNNHARKAQLFAIVIVAHRLRVRITAVFGDSGPARPESQPQLKAMLEYLSQQPTTYCIAYRASCLTRSPEHYRDLSERMEGYGTRIADCVGLDGAGSELRGTPDDLRRLFTSILSVERSTS